MNPNTPIARLTPVERAERRVLSAAERVAAFWDTYVLVEGASKPPNPKRRDAVERTLFTAIADLASDVSALLETRLDDDDEH